MWFLIVILTIGYMISRGLAKSGSRDPYTEQPMGSDDDSLGERVKAAAQVLTEGSPTLGAMEQGGRVGVRSAARASR